MISSPQVEQLLGSIGNGPMLTPWPLPRPREWLEYMNKLETEAELSALRPSTVRGAPFGKSDWLANATQKFGMECTLRNPDQPKSQLTWPVPFDFSCPRLIHLATSF